MMPLTFGLRLNTNIITSAINKTPPSTHPRMIQRVLQEEESTLKTATRDVRVPSFMFCVEEDTDRHDFELFTEVTEREAKFVEQLED